MGDVSGTHSDGYAAKNPVTVVERPAIKIAMKARTLGFSKSQARKLLDLPSEETIAGLRDRAILSVGLQVGLRRAEIAALAGVKFATDSALEGAGFEPSVPLAKEGRGH